MLLEIQLSIALLCLISFGIAQNQCPTPGEECKDIRQCSILNNLIRKPNLSSAERKLISDRLCGYLFGHQWICCPLALRRRSAAVELPKPGVCGSQLEPQLVDGVTNGSNYLPWMVLLEYTYPNGSKDFDCAGVLINENYVLTASHCVNDRILAQRTLSGVRIGEWNHTSNKDCEEGICLDPVQNVRVAELIPHENYNLRKSRTSENDIALLRLERPINYTEWIRPICLPISGDFANRNYDGVSLIVGVHLNGARSDVKMKIEINGVPNTHCNNMYRARLITLTTKQLCAGGEEGKDSCNGDSGGPLMVKHVLDGNATHIIYYLVGVVSFGRTPCGQAGWPGVYTRVDQYVDWIKDNIKP
ncbi:serine protease easter-like [Contarinia nasturtii]|uniref:serine protease easter-like n=1 Tax=Contarinia nasturtii TaxID=265458 RepID=UPI0012D4AE70|nr:serine protease easter-like [Contarinia nasturtii]